ncbi:MAG: hypothetical protein J0L93_03005 [Deltaproteobacteria bacterium]|nr:hypothetical protein [Deltaproteobacteria bacterium]
MFAINALIILSTLVAAKSSSNIHSENESLKIEIPSANAELMNRDFNSSTKSGELEFSASSWFPENWTSESRTGEVSYEQSIPTFGVGFISKPFSEKIGLSADVAVGILEAQRKSGQSTQKSYLLPARVGLELAPFRFWKILPFIRTSFLPSLIISHSSPIAEGKTEWAVPFSFSSGLQFQFSKEESQGMKRLLPSAFQFHWTMTQAVLGKPNLSGMGWAGGLRFSL